MAVAENISVFLFRYGDSIPWEEAWDGTLGSGVERFTLQAAEQLSTSFPMVTLGILRQMEVVFPWRHETDGSRFALWSMREGGRVSEQMGGTLGRPS